MDGEQCNAGHSSMDVARVRETKAKSLGGPRPSPRRSASAVRASIGCRKRCMCKSKHVLDRRRGLNFRSFSLLSRAGKRFAEYIYQQRGAQKLPSGWRLPLRVRQGECDQIVCCHMGRNAACR